MIWIYLSKKYLFRLLENLSFDDGHLVFNKHFNLHRILTNEHLHDPPHRR